MQWSEPNARGGSRRVPLLSVALAVAAMVGGAAPAAAVSARVDGAFGRMVVPFQGKPRLEGGALIAADRLTPSAPGPLRTPDPGTSCGPLVSDPGTFCLDMGRQFGPTNKPDIRFPNYQEVADQIARSSDPAKRAKAIEYLNQARDAWTSGFHETALDLLRTAQVALY